jgi:hypothetical protein
MLSKYSNKILQYINNTNYIDYLNSISDLKSCNLKSIPFFNNLYNSQNKSKIKIEFKSKEVSLPILHKKENLPLIYLLFKKLYELKLFDTICKTSPDITIFSNFIQWYRKNQHSINYDNIKSIIKKSKNTDLLNIYDILFNLKSSNIRKNIHELLYENSFVGLDVQHHYETSELYFIEVKCDNIILYLYYTKEHKENLDNIINNIFEINQFLINFIKKYKNINENICYLTIFLGIQKKYFPFNKDDKFLAPDNINSGSTYVGRSVSIWRSEELLKVLTHELIHFYGLDFYFTDKYYSDIESFILSKFNITGFDRNNESYTETLAILIHTMFVSFKSGIDYKKLLSYEIAFLLLQTKKILLYYSDKADFSDILTGKIHFIHNTSVISYFIIKLLLMLNICSFTEFIDSNGIICKNTDIIKYKNVVEDVFNNSHNLTENINKFWSEFELPENKFISKTIRMSAIELNFKNN